MTDALPIPALDDCEIQMFGISKLLPSSVVADRNPVSVSHFYDRVNASMVVVFDGFGEMISLPCLCAPSLLDRCRLQPCLGGRGRIAMVLGPGPVERLDWNGGFVVSREDPQKAWLSDTNTSGPFRGSIPILMGEVSTPKRQLQVSNNEVRATALISLAVPSSSALHLLIPTSLQSCTKSPDPRLQYRKRYRRAMVSSKNQCVGEPHHVTLSAKNNCKLGHSQTKTTSQKTAFPCTL